MNTLQVEIISELAGLDEGLSDWEKKFISGMADKDPDTYELSAKQNAALFKIAKKLKLGIECTTCGHVS